MPTAITTETGDLVNWAMETLQDEHNFWVMQAETAVTSTSLATRDLMVLPSNFKSPRGKPYEIWNDGNTQDLNWGANREAVYDLFTHSDANDKGPPEVLLISEPDDESGTANIEVYPYPDGNSDYVDGEYRIVIPYWKWLTALSGDSDQNWFTNNAEHYLVAKATARGFALNWDEERMAVWEQLAAGELRKVLKKDKRRSMGFVTHLIVRKGARGPKIGR